MALSIIIVMVAGYLLGNLNGAILISQLMMKEDVRTKGSGNAGLTNFQRNYGNMKSLFVLGIDALKTVAAALLGGWLLGQYGYAEIGQMIGGAMTVVGHMFPVFFSFRGGKGILCCAALAAVMDWRIFVVLILLFILVVAFSRYVSMASCLCAVAFAPLIAWGFWGQWTIVTIGVALAGSVLYMHRANIVRLFKGTENKLSFHSKKTK